MSTDKKRYRLLKDLPDADAGIILIFDGNDCYDYKSHREVGALSWYKKDFVENNPEWFEEVKEASLPEPIRVSGMYQMYIKDGVFHDPSEKCFLRITFNINSIDNNKYPAIKQAIEQAINSKEGLPLPDDYIGDMSNICVVDKVGCKKPLSDFYLPKYSQQEVDTIRKEMEDLLSTSICCLRAFVDFTREGIKADETSKDAQKIIEYYEANYKSPKPTPTEHKEQQFFNVMDRVEFDWVVYTPNNNILLPQHKFIKVQGGIKSCQYYKNTATVSYVRPDNKQTELREFQFSELTKLPTPPSTVTTDNTDVPCLTANEACEIFVKAMGTNTKSFREVVNEYVTKKLKQ